jgi:hypothetical protein
MPAGRPSSYDPAYCELILEFFNTEPFVEGTDAMDKPTIRPLKLPTVQRFAANIGVHKDTIHEWARVHPEFSVSLKQALDMQADALIQGGLFGSYEKTIAKMLLSANHGLHEKTEQSVKAEVNQTSVQVTAEATPEQAAEAYNKLIG